MKKFIFGLGTGRCGTVSLSTLLDSQPDSLILHEGRPLDRSAKAVRLPHLPWEPDRKLLQRKLADYRSRPYSVVGDVAFYYLPYVHHIQRLHPDAYFVCMKRDKDETVRSYLKKTARRNHWIEHDGSEWIKDPRWDPCYPKYDLENKVAAIGRYWDDYYAISEMLEHRHQNFKIFNIECLNSDDGLRAILGFLGIKDKTIIRNLVLNKSER